MVALVSAVASGGLVGGGLSGAESSSLPSCLKGESWMRAVEKALLFFVPRSSALSLKRRTTPIGSSNMGQEGLTGLVSPEGGKQTAGSRVPHGSIKDESLS